MTARLLTAAAAMLLAVPASAAPVPFVGCASDGQLGPQLAPRAGPTPDVPASAAARLAWYAGADGIGVLAPRGWRCQASMGSNGRSITVAPHPLSWQSITTRASQTGPVVSLSQSSGGTSGRFEVAAVAARLFPAARAFVAQVQAEGTLSGPLPATPYPADRLTRRGAYRVLFTTPPRRTGLGTDWTLAPGRLPVDGVAILHPESDMDLDVLRARLPAANRRLAATIIAEVTSR